VIGDETEPALRDLRTALRDVSKAAEAVGSLARAIERRPNSLLTGR
jgi:paraquat-inducible protein B